MMMKARNLTLHTEAWYGDRLIELPIPDHWDVTVHEPRCVTPLTARQIADHLEAPVGQKSLRELCRGKSAPLIIVDDLYRPTPAASVLPHMLKIFLEEQIDLSKVTILMATGTHGAPPEDALPKKVGEAASGCRTLVHNCFRNIRNVGSTTLGTPVHVNQAVLESDCVIGLGGIYPNHTVGFGGGVKIVLGVLGVRSVFHLHHNHPSVGWGEDGLTGAFRQDLNEIAKMVGMQMCVSVQINARREIIAFHCGNPEVYFPDAVEFCKEVFTVPRAEHADVVISNAYPNDLSLTFARIKGFVPLSSCRAEATRIAIASCREGVGLHNLYPYVNFPRFHRLRHLVRSLRSLPFSEFYKRVVGRLHQAHPFAVERTSTPPSEKHHVSPQNPVWMYRPGSQPDNLPQDLPGLHIVQDWDDILNVVALEQGENRRLNVAVYPCSFLQNIC